MTPIEIAYFKHFMLDKDLARSFLQLYRTRHINGSPRGDKDANPYSIEAYFLRTTVKDVIMKAFHFALNSNAPRIDYTHDYWKDIDDKWQAYMADNAANFTNDSWPMLRKSFAILRQNLDIPYYWKRENLESTAEVYERMHIDLPLPEFQWEHGYVPKKNEGEAEEKPAVIEPRFNVGDKIQGLISGDIVTITEVCSKGYFTDDDGFVDIDRQDMWAIVTETADAPIIDFTDEEDDPLADFDFFDDVLPGNYRLKPNEISVNFKGGNKITFNQMDSKIIRESGLKFARLARSKTGDICLIINRQKGASLTNISGKKGNLNATINSADICGKLRTLFNLKSDYSILIVENLQATQEFIIYKITKQ